MKREDSHSSKNFGEVLEQRFERRALLGGLMKSIPATALLATSAPAAAAEAAPEAAAAASPAPQAKRETRL